MPIIAMLLAASPMPVHATSASACRPAQLRLSLDADDGAFNGMSHGGTRLSVRNVGRDCILPALPTILLLDARRRVLPVARRAPVGMHPGPAMVPVLLTAGHRVATELRWTAGPVFSRNRSVRSATLTLRIGAAVLRSPLRATLYGEAGKSVWFEQAPLHAVEGMAAG